MTNAQLCAISAAIYIAPHLPAPLGAFIGIVFAVGGYFV